MENIVKDKEKTCRICYKQDIIMVPIFNEKLGVSPYENLVHHTNLNISYNDGGSESICMPCSEELEILVKFLNKCVKANDLFATTRQNNKGPTKIDKDASKNDKDATKNDKDASKNDKDASKNDKEASKNDKDASKNDKDALNNNKDESQSDSDDNKLIINEDSVPSDNEHDPNNSTKINTTKTKKHECPCCHKKFTRPENLKLHLYRHNGERKHNCIKCGAGVLTRALAKQHCAQRPRRPCPIPGCKMTFLSSQNLQTHVRKHTGEKPFECANCHKKFGSKSILCSHMKIHLDIKPYKCPICGKEFATNKLPLHMRTHTPSTAPVPSTCTVCARAFPSTRSLARHFFTHGPKLRQHACTKCNAAYNHKKSLTKHIKKVHTELQGTTTISTTTTENPDSKASPTASKMDTELKQ